MTKTPADQNRGIVAREEQERATRIWQHAYQRQLAGDLNEAVALYKASIDILPTPEAHTFLGWTYSFQGRYHEAIAECHRAIEIDSEFGNSWNDIGAYLIELDRAEESIPYFKRALKAERYASKHFPHFNLGRVYEKLGRWYEAIAELDAAMEILPDYIEAYRAKMELVARLN
ncbi:MAG: tetratricopeptide repeat protein [Acidobacteriota bacterium]